MPNGIGSDLMTEKKKILECSSKGDKRFSAFCACVKAWGKYDSIENHYQLAKRFGDFIPTHWRDAKGQNNELTHMSLNGRDYELRFLEQWYKMLWLEYLDKHPELVTFLEQFDDYNDMFKGRSKNCQADVIRQYIKQGRDSLVEDTRELRELFKKKVE